jgi:hypothetical protein
VGLHKNEIEKQVDDFFLKNLPKKFTGESEKELKKRKCSHKNCFDFSGSPIKIRTKAPHG